MLSSITPAILPGKRSYALLGRLLLRNEPELARRLLAGYHNEARPAFTDLSKIPDLFQAFCTLQRLTPSEYIGTLRKTVLVDNRRIFVAVLLRLYVPRAFEQPEFLHSHGRSGLLKLIAEHFQQSKGNISRLAHEAIRWANQYDDFSETVLRITHQIEAHGHPEA